MFAYKNFNSEWNKNEKEKKKHQTPLKWKMDFSNFCMDRRWMDELGFYIRFNSNSVISGRWKGEHERLCENEALFRFAKNLASSWIPGACDAKLGALTALLWIEECSPDYCYKWLGVKGFKFHWFDFQEYTVSEERKEDQATVDKQILEVIRKHPEKKLLFGYLGAMFSLGSRQYPHKMVF